MVGLLLTGRSGYPNYTVGWQSSYDMSSVKFECTILHIIVNSVALKPRPHMYNSARAYYALVQNSDWTKIYPDQSYYGSIRDGLKIL